MKHKLLLILSLSVLGGQALAQGTEPFWSVEAEKTKTGIPEYEGGTSPFPYVEPPQVVEVVEVVKAPEPVYNPELAAREARNRKAAEILAEIRDILATESAFNPDLRSVRVSGIIRGERSTSALIGNQWILSGQELQVPVQAVEQLMGLVNYLETLSGDLAADVRRKIDQRLADIGNFKLKLDRVDGESVVFKDNRNKTYVILFDSMS